MSEQMMICNMVDKCKNTTCFHYKPHKHFPFCCELECPDFGNSVKCIPHEEKQPAQPKERPDMLFIDDLQKQQAKDISQGLLDKYETKPKKRVRAYKEDWVTRAVTAEVKVHQLQVENNKLREALAAIVGGGK
jgi:hypothetical protein